MLVGEMNGYVWASTQGAESVTGQCWNNPSKVSLESGKGNPRGLIGGHDDAQYESSAPSENCRAEYRTARCSSTSLRPGDIRAAY